MTDHIGKAFAPKPAGNPTPSSALPFPRIFMSCQTTAEFTNSPELFSRLCFNRRHDGQVTSHQSPEIIRKLLRTRTTAVGAVTPTSAEQPLPRTERCKRVRLHQKHERGSQKSKNEMQARMREQPLGLFCINWSLFGGDCGDTCKIFCSTKYKTGLEYH